MAHAAGDTTMGAAIGGDGQDVSFWRSHTTISLSPVAAPSILGLYGFAASTFMVAGWLAGWYGTALTPFILFPFTVVFGGLAQFLAGMWAYRARDPLATAMHGMWGAFWIAYGIYNVLILTGALPLAVTVPTTTAGRQAQLALGWWFIVLAAVTWIGAVASLATSISLTLVLGTLAAGATILAIAWVTPYSITVQQAAADVIVASAVFAFYTASALMLEGSFKRPILPVFHWTRPRGGPPVRARLEPIQYEMGEPGVKAGQ